MAPKNITNATALCAEQYRTRRFRALFRASPLGFPACGGGPAYRPFQHCNFMLDLSCPCPQSLVVFVHTCSFNRVALFAFFRFASAFSFTSRAGSRSLSINFTILCKSICSIPAARFCTIDSLITNSTRKPNPS